MGSIPAGDAVDADKAVRAAREALASWSTTSPAERAGYLKRAAEGLQLRQTEIATLVSQEVGMPFAYSNVIQVGLPVQSFVSIADVVLSFPFERRVYNSLVVREPIGVWGNITIDKVRQATQIRLGEAERERAEAALTFEAIMEEWAALRREGGRSQGRAHAAAGRSISRIAGLAMPPKRCARSGMACRAG